jgi:hypothetical protein
VILTSVITLSITQKLTGIIDYKKMVEYIKHWAPADFLQLNLEAIEIGRTLI